MTKAIYEYFKEHSVVVIEQDYYYKDQSHLPFEERLKTNYDHPLAFDNDLLIEHIKQLLNMNQLKNRFMIIPFIHVQKKQFMLNQKMLLF